MLCLGYDDRKHCVKQFAAGTRSHPSTHRCAKYHDSLPRSFPQGQDQLPKARVVSLLSRDFRGINRREKTYASLFHVPLTSPTSCVPEDLPIPWEPLKVKLPQYRTIYYDTGRHFAKSEIRFKLAARGSAPCTPGRPGKPLASPDWPKTRNISTLFNRGDLERALQSPKVLVI